MEFLDPRHLIETFGYIGLFVIVFAESGLFFGFFLPGDSLLLTAGLFASNGVLDERLLLPIVFVAAVLGDNVGYWFGRKTGPPLFKREKSLLFRPKNLEAARNFYEKHGGKTIILARFMPFIRTFAPIVAGAVDMNYRSFMLYNLAGAFLWGIGVTMAGFLLGRMFAPEVLDRYFLIIVVVVVLLSVLPTALHLWKENGPSLLARLRGRPAPADD
ncbi:MAG: DedA family protein [Anaerolineales bacterium]|nr:DedA family protein [Anaerolineales bacterium]